MTADPQTALTTAQQAVLIERLTALGDDELILAHRNSEWVGHAPILEEDIALANLVQDELGHANFWYGLRGALDGSDPDALAYRRDASDFRCARLLELPRGDWAFTLLRQFLFDAYEALWLDAGRASTHVPLREAAEKMLREERFHLQHTSLWVERLGLGTEESNRRTQAALDTQWALTAQLFAPLPGESELVAAGLLPDVVTLQNRWLDLVTGHLTRSGLTIPTIVDETDSSRAVHTEHLAPMLAEMQEVARFDPEATAW